MNLAYPGVACMLLMVAIVATSSTASDTTTPPAPTIRVLADETFADSNALHAVIGTADWLPGSATGRHYHAGDEYATVIEGAIEVRSEGQPPRTYKAGEAYHNKRGVVHVARNASSGNSKINFVLITDKGAPLQVLVPQGSER